MSFIAEIQGKSPFYAFEDFLTSDVFTSLKEGFEKERFDGKFSMSIHSFDGYCER